MSRKVRGHWYYCCCAESAGPCLALPLESVAYVSFQVPSAAAVELLDRHHAAPSSIAPTQDHSERKRRCINKVAQERYSKIIAIISLREGERNYITSSVLFFTLAPYGDTLNQCPYYKQVGLLKESLLVRSRQYVHQIFQTATSIKHEQCLGVVLQYHL